jgi:Asp-tRNA(Asn)/Glu-tRNA(Gln) amidotransferase A subunit family amidase
MDLRFASAADLARAIQRGDLSPTQLMEFTLQQLEHVNPKLNAFVATHPADRLMEQARAVEQRLARKEEVGPLAGLPLGVKDLEDTVGLPTTHGSLLFRDRVATRDTIQVARLKQAGAIVVGKTNTPEFGYTAFTHNRVFGPTRNPWNLERTPGGSSGGSSAAIAGGIVPLATASDGGGSVRIPAAFTGLVGLKPSQGRIPWGPEDALRFSHCIVSGPLTRSVEDAALWLDVTVGPHPEDPFSLPHPGYSYREVIRQQPPRLRIAYSPTLGYARPARSVQAAVEAALTALEKAGHRIEWIELTLEDIVFDWARLMAVEDYAFHGAHFHDEDLLDPGYRIGVELAKQLRPADLGDVLRLRQRLVASFENVLARFDLLATPTTAAEPFAAEGPIPLEVDGEPVATPGGAIAYTYPFNFSGHPAISLRAGRSPSGLPVGIQFVGPRFREDLLLQLAAEFEQLLPWAHDWPRL